MRKRPSRSYVLNAPGPGATHMAFVPHPNYRGAWLHTDECVAFIACDFCGSPAGVPCRDPDAWSCTVHVDRREAFRSREFLGVGKAVDARIVERSDPGTIKVRPLRVAEVKARWRTR